MKQETWRVIEGNGTSTSNMDAVATTSDYDSHQVLEVRCTSYEKPKLQLKEEEVEVVVVDYAALPERFLSPIDQRLTLYNPPSTLTNPNPNSVSKQFWKAGHYEGPSLNNFLSHLAGMDHLRVHPRFLHSNATSHKWALGAFAELFDNSLDEVHTGATYVNVDVLNNELDTRSKMLLVEELSILHILMADNGGGMTPDNMRRCHQNKWTTKKKKD